VLWRFKVFDHVFLGGLGGRGFEPKRVSTRKAMSCRVDTASANEIRDLEDKDNFSPPQKFPILEISENIKNIKK
jgi:hypothetical protein